jgi:hypothetical protein
MRKASLLLLLHHRLLKWARQCWPSCCRACAPASSSLSVYEPWATCVAWPSSQRLTCACNSCRWVASMHVPDVQVLSMSVFSMRACVCVRGWGGELCAAANAAGQGSGHDHPAALCIPWEVKGFLEQLQERQGVGDCCVFVCACATNDCEWMCMGTLFCWVVAKQLLDRT